MKWAFYVMNNYSKRCIEGLPFFKVHTMLCGVEKWRPERFSKRNQLYAVLAFERLN